MDIKKTANLSKLQQLRETHGQKSKRHYDLFVLFCQEIAIIHAESFIFNSQLFLLTWDYSMVFGIPDNKYHYAC